MKIVKQKEVQKIVESIEVEPGTYYFDDDTSYYKIEFTETNTDGWDVIEYYIEKVQYYSNKRSINIYSDSEETLPYFVQELWKNAAKQMKKEDYEQIRKDLIQSL